MLRRQQFDQLTEASDALLRAGRFDIYSERRERIYEQLQDSQQAAKATAQGPSASVLQDADAEAAGIDPSAHAAAVASGFVLDASRALYFNSGSGLFYDPKSSLYWPAAGGCYYYWDSAQGQFVPTEVQEGVAAAPTGQHEGAS